MDTKDISDAKNAEDMHVDVIEDSVTETKGIELSGKPRNVESPDVSLLSVKADKLNDEIKLEKIVLTFIKKSKEGRTVSELTELVKTANTNGDVQSILSGMIAKGKIKKLKGRFHIKKKSNAEIKTV